MPLLQLRFTPTYADYISVVNSRSSGVMSDIEKEKGVAIPRSAKILLKPIALSWATFQFFTKKRKAGEFTLAIDESGMEIGTRHGSNKTAWSDIAKVEQHETGYILLGRKGYGPLIPKRVMTEDERVRLESLIAAWQLARQRTLSGAATP